MIRRFVRVAGAGKLGGRQGGKRASEQAGKQAVARLPSSPRRATENGAGSAAVGPPHGFTHLRAAGAGQGRLSAARFHVSSYIKHLLLRAGKST